MSELDSCCNQLRGLPVCVVVKTHGGSPVVQGDAVSLRLRHMVVAQWYRVTQSVSG